MRRRTLLLAASASTLLACTTDPGLATFQRALVETVKDEEVLSKICKREITRTEANGAMDTMQGKEAKKPGELSFPNFSSKRSTFGKDGTGQTDILYVPKEGEPCRGEMTFSFHQEGTAEKIGKRGTKYTSSIDLSNVVITAK